MELLVRAPLSSFLDDDADDDAATASSLSSGASSPPLSPSPSAAASPPLPRVAAQLSSMDEDVSEEYDDTTTSGEDGELLVEEVSNGFFFPVARVPPPPPLELPPADETRAAPQGGESGAPEERFASVFQGLDAGAGSGLGGAIADARVTAVDVSFQSSRSSVDGAVDDGASGEPLTVSDVPVLMDDGKQDASVEAVNDVLTELFAAVTGGDDMHIVGSLEGSDDEVAEFLPVVDATGEDAGAVELRTDDSDAKDSRDKQEDVTDVEDVGPEYVAIKDGTSDPVEADENVDDPESIADDGHSSKVDEKTDDDHEAFEDPASVQISGSDNALEDIEEFDDNVPVSRASHLHLYDFYKANIDGDDEDEEEVNGRKIELIDHADIAELLRAANRSPAHGTAKVFPVESSESRHLPPTVVSIPRTDKASALVLGAPADPEKDMTDDEKKLYRKVDAARIKYMRLIHRLGYDTSDQVPIQVLYRLSLVEGFRRIRIANQFSELENAWKRAVQLEAEGTEDLEFSCNVLVLGKTGVGKSATINSIFGEDKSKTNAFLRATSSVKEITGVVDGVKFRVIDTPGLGTSAKDEKLNRKVLNSVKKYIKRCPPDIILYVDRIDTQREEANSLSLLQVITSVLGLSIWPRTIITLTHSGAAPPEGPSGMAMDYEMLVTRRTHAIQQSIRQATNGLQIENPVALVENHHLCQRNTEGEKVLPDGRIWRRCLLLLCYSRKMVTEVESLSTRRAPSPSLFGHFLQVPRLPYFLSSLLQSREHPKRSSDHNLGSVDSDFDLDELLNEDPDSEEDDYDQLPPFKPLSKSQVAKLSKEQQKSYFDEYDYRIKLLQKKQLKEQVKRFKEMKKDGGNHEVSTDDDLPDDEYVTYRSPMPDWALPSSFDSDDPVYRYRCLEPMSNLLVHAVNSPDGWDHDCGFDGVSLQHSLDVANKFPAFLWIQVNKDKREFMIHLDSSMSAKHGDYGSSLAGFDIQPMMDQFAYTFRGETKIKNFKKNTTAGGLSMTFLGNNMVTGAKFEDKLSVNNRIMLVANTGVVSMRGDTAYGLNMKANLREKSYPVGQGLTTLCASIVRWRKEWIMVANLDSQFSVGRTSNVAVHVDVNNKQTGRVSIKASTSEQLKIALLGICSATMYLWNRMHPGGDPNFE